MGNDFEVWTHIDIVQGTTDHTCEEVENPELMILLFP